MPAYFYQPDFIYTVVLFCLIFLALINRHKIKQLLDNFRTKRCLDNLGLEQIHNFSFTDELDQYISIDRIILLERSILMLNHKKYPGKIFGSEKIDEWTQMIALKSYKFENPLFALNIQRQALQELIPDITIEARLFFDSSADFPKQIPKQTIHPHHIDKHFCCQADATVKPDVMQAWDKLKSMKKNA